MQVRLLSKLTFVLSLAFLLVLVLGGALTGAARPGPTASQGVPVARTGDVGPFAGGASRQMRFGDSHFSLEPSAPCEVGGLIMTDTTWSPSECDPYVVTGNLSVQPGATLTVQPGTTVKFDSLKVLAVAGTLVARGTVTNPITFTSNLPSLAAGNWGYIHFSDSSVDATFDGEGHYTGGSIIQYAVIEYAGGADVSYNGALRIEASSPFIDHNIIRDNQDAGIHVWSGSAPHITDNSITTSSDDGIHTNDSDAIISGNTINSNSGDGIYAGSGSPTIQGNTIDSNSGDGIYADSSNPTIHSNTIKDNSSSGIYVYSVFSGAPTIQDNTITGNSASQGGGIYIRYGTAIVSGNIITGNTASRGGGIYLYSTSPTITNNTITANTATQENRGGGIYLNDGCLPTISDNDLYDNMTGDLANIPNDLYNGNQYGGDAMDAKNNRWHTTEWRVIEDRIWHFMDDPALGIVSYDSFPSIPCAALGIINTDTTWSPGECDHYVVTGNLSVQPGATLTIQPGTTIRFDQIKVLAVAGTLVARGTEADPITFTSNQASSAAGDWGCIYFADPSTDATFDGGGNYTGGSIIQYAVIEYAGGADGSHNGALHIEASSPFIDHNIIRDNQDDGIHANDSDAITSNNTVDNNAGYGIHVRYESSCNSRTATISDNTVISNTGYGIYLFYDHWNDNNVATISDNTVTDNGDGGISVRYDFWNDNNTAVVSGNVITGNSASNGGGIYVDYASDNENITMTVSSNTITGNSASSGGGIYIGYGSPIIHNNTIISNTAIQPNRGGGIYLCNGCRPSINNNDLYGNTTGDLANIPNDLYNGNAHTGAAVNAENNYWDTADPAVIEDHIWHFQDDPSLDPVDYAPYTMGGSPAPPPPPPCDVSGLIDSDTNWSPGDCDPYVVIGNLSVQAGATLTIQPGTTVKFDRLKVLAVAGTLVARGNFESPITFTSILPSQAAGDWGYIHFADLSADATFDGEGNYTGGSIIQHAVIEYAGGAGVSQNGALRIEASSPFIDHNTIRDNQHDGIHVWSGGAPHITDNSITTSSDDGIHTNDSDAIISNNTVDNNAGYGIHVRYESSCNSRTATISDNTVISNTGYGIYLFYDHWNDNNVATISDNTVTDNGDGGISVRYDFWNDNNTAVVSGNVITSNSASNGGGIYIDYGSDNENTTMTISNNTITGNTASNGGGIHISGGDPIIHNNAIIGNTATQRDRGGGIYLCNGCRPTINDNNIHSNVTGDSANIPNDLYNGNGYIGVAVNAENNYWDTVDPAVIEDHIFHGWDNPDLEYVDFEPFRLSPVPPYTPTRAIQVIISGPATGVADVPYVFTATAGPITATQPITYAWQATEQSPVTHTGGLSDTVTFTWPTTGTKTIIVTASNTQGSADANHGITIRPPDQDAYEPDDTCTHASALSTNGAAQQHTFHQQADQDWAYFSVTSGITYVLQAASTSPGADMVLELYDACDGNLEGSDDNAFGNDAYLSFTASSDGTYYVKALNHDPATYGPDVTYDLSVRVLPSNAVALIVAGHDTYYRLQNNILHCANSAFLTFRRGGLTRANLRYLSDIDDDAQTDADGDGVSDVDADSTSTNVEDAITNWAANLADAETPFYLYLMDHGGIDAFLTDGSGDTITPDELDGWLTTLEDDGVPVNVIYEACHSGSFIDGLKAISRPGRVVIASTGRLNNAYPSRRGALFSDAFFTQLGQSSDLYTSFRAAKGTVEATGLWQTPWLDDDGNGVPNSGDGDVARQRGLPIFGFIDRPPVIDRVTPPTSIVEGDGVLRAQVRDDSGTAVDVWAVVYPPSFEEPAPTEDGTMPDLGLPRVELSDTDGDDEYVGLYEDFTEDGAYQVVVYAQDAAGNHALPAVTTVRTRWWAYLPQVCR